MKSIKSNDFSIYLSNFVNYYRIKTTVKRPLVVVSAAVIEQVGTMISFLYNGYSVKTPLFFESQAREFAQAVQFFPINQYAANTYTAIVGAARADIVFA